MTGSDDDVFERLPEPGGVVDDPSVEDIPPEGLDETAGQESDYTGNVSDESAADPSPLDPTAPDQGGR